MSRVAKKPVVLPKGVETIISGQLLTIKGAKGKLEHNIPESVKVVKEEEHLLFAPNEAFENADAIAGSTRAVVQNMVTGVTQGFEKKLILVGVGYRAQMQGTKLALSLGFSHPVSYDAPAGITIETPTQTEVRISGTSKHLVGQVAADIRAIRPPEPYKGKGVKYFDEKIILKEAKKK